jgi:transcriptional regulator with XRE-family HTH domain
MPVPKTEQTPKLAKQRTGGSEQEPGRRLRRVRERLELKYRDVQEATQAIAQARANQEFAIGLSRLADIENRGTVPSVYRLYSLCAVYGLSLGTVLGWYGVHLAKLPSDKARTSHRRTHLIEVEKFDERAQQDSTGTLPVDWRQTSFLGRHLPHWDALPPVLQKLQPERRYAVIGSEDWSMYPILSPGAFVQVDDRRRKPETGPWATDFHRPIYLVEKHDGFRCGWCSLKGRQLTLQFHPCSGLDPEHVITPTEGEIVGQIVGVAMRLDPARRRRIRS